MLAVSRSLGGAAAAALFPEKADANVEPNSIEAAVSEAAALGRTADGSGGLSPEQVLAVAEGRVKVLFDALRESLQASGTNTVSKAD